MAKLVYSFGAGRAEGCMAKSDLLGGKGANLAEMCRLGLPVPPGFTISTEVCTYFHDHDSNFPPDLEQHLEQALHNLERITGAGFGSAENPLLLSVRPGARVSMPGLMETVLNVGLNDQTVQGLAAESGDSRFAHDTYRRLIQMYGQVVLGVPHEVFEKILAEEKEQHGYLSDADFSAEIWREVISRFQEAIRKQSSEAFPQDPRKQLWNLIVAAFESWAHSRIVKYRNLHTIPDRWGTAVTVQAMVFGNKGRGSAAGIAFSRDPETGAKRLQGRFLPNAQGDDIVLGFRSPQPLTEADRRQHASDGPSLEASMPEIFKCLASIAAKLEEHHGDMQFVEFTIEEGKLWILQTQPGRRSLRARLRIAVDMADEGQISREQAICRIDPASLEQLLHPTVDKDAPRDLIAIGMPASPGAATGEIVFTPEEAEDRAASGKKVILVRTETGPDDIQGMLVSEGILTTRGGMTSHAAVVARGMGKPCVCGTGSLRLDVRAGTLSALGRRFKRGDVITVDGSSGQVLSGAVPLRQPTLSGAFSTLMDWADAKRRMDVRANAETPEDARAARSFGALGIGLCRTEHMFFGSQRILSMRELLLAETPETRRRSLSGLLPFQRSDFIELFEIMAGLPVAIRLLDMPLHEFLPPIGDDLKALAAHMKIDARRLRRRVDNLREMNPMLGLRGCRLVVCFPEIAEMQARAIFEAAIEAGAKTGIPVVPEITVPLVSVASEFSFVKNIINRIAAQVMEEKGVKIQYLVGAMIELPRAALNAGEIAKDAEFFSFGTNDLTQTTFGMSRDDAGNFLEAYQRGAIIKQDPFVTLDKEGVGLLIRMATERGRAVRPNLKLGICGEHGGDPASIDFFNEIGLDYVSCSPYRVPIARLAAAQSAIEMDTAE